MAETERRWTIQHFRPVTTTEEAALAEVVAILRDLVRAEGFVMADDTLRRSQGPEPIKVDDRVAAGWVPSTDMQADGWLSTWDVAATFRVTDEHHAVIVSRIEGAVTATVPEAVAAAGGGVRVMHNLGGPVFVVAFSGDNNRIGYVFTQPLSDDEEHVEVVPTTTHLVVTRDPEP